MIKKGIAFLTLITGFFLKLNSTDLNPIQSVYITSITYTWTSIPSSSYNAVLSTTPSFSPYISSQTLISNTTTYEGLKGNTTYYFEVKLSTEPDASYVIISTITYPQTPYSLNVIYNLYDAFYQASQIVIDFPTSNAPDTKYLILYSTAADISVNISSSYIIGQPPLSLNTLLTNTTYYFKIKAIDRIGRETPFSDIISTQTITKSPDKFSLDIFETSTTFNWQPVNGINENGSAGYLLLISQDSKFSVIVSSWQTNDPSISSYTIASLLRNSTYYYSFSVLNSIGVENQINGEIHTLSLKPSNFKLISYSSYSLTCGWDSFLQSPPQDSALGYTLIASTTPDFNYGVISSNTFNLLLSTLTIPSLSPNTTYYIKAGSINHYGLINYTDTISTITLAIPVDAKNVGYIMNPKSITARFIGNSDSYEFLKSYGYRFDLSTTNFNSQIVYSSFTPFCQNQSCELTIENLRPNTTYYARIYTFNSAGVENFNGTTQLFTPIPSISPDVVITYYSSNTLIVNYSTVDADGYIIEASTDNFFRIINFSSQTFSNLISTLSLTNLIPDTLYYIREGSLFNGTTIYQNATPFYIRTLSPPPYNLNLANVGISSITISWSTVGCRGYSFEASTDSSFSLLISSLTLTQTIPSLTIEGLKPNTTYYLRVGSLNSDDIKNYTYYQPTSTLANYPVELPLTNITTYSMQLNWDKNSNPDDTVYFIEISSTNFQAGNIYSMSTTNNYAIFTNLQSNTTYYKRITSLNRYNIPTGPTYFTPIATLAFKPVNLTIINSTHTLTLNWDDPNNAPGTIYLAEISSTGFINAILSSTTLSKSATFYNLNANTPYHIRVSALNFSNIPSIYETSLSTTYVETPQITTPTFINILLDGFTAQWDNNTNSTHTIYYIEASTTSNFSSIFKSTQTNKTTFVFGDLKYNTPYYIRMKAKGLIDNNFSDYLYLGEISTLYREEKIINNQIYQSVSIPYSYGNIEVDFPPYSLGSITKVFIEPELSPPPPTTKAGILNPTGFAARIWIFPVVLYNGKIIVKIPFKDLPPSINKNRLIMARYDESVKLWVPLKSYIENNYVIGETYHFSIFQIMEFLQSNDLSNPKIYPNPYKPNTFYGKLSFSNMPANTEIKIYTITGELVKKLITNESGFVQWDGKNESNREVSSGVYLVVFKDKKGEKVIKKLAVEK